MEVSGGPTLADRIIDLAENLNRLQQQLREIWIMAEAEDTNRRWEEKRRASLPSAENEKAGPLQ